jgi:hypothetical protein
LHQNQPLRDVAGGAANHRSAPLTDPAAKPKLASGPKAIYPGERAFVLQSLAAELPWKNARRYDELVSGRAVYTYVGNDPLDRTDPSGNYSCGSSMDTTTCQNFTNAQDSAKAQIQAGIKTINGIQQTLASGGKLSASQQQAANTINKVMGAGAGTDSKVLSSLAASGEKMLGVLNSSIPAQVSSGSTDYAHADPGQLSLFKPFFSSSAQQQSETVAHESFHHATGLHDPNPILVPGNSNEIYPYGVRNLGQYANYHDPSFMLQVPDAVTISLGVPRDDAQ